MKLQLKYLAGYLPYELKVLDEKAEPKDNIFTLESASIHEKVTDCDGNVDIPFSEIKPILRPLSDLTKEIEVNGKKFVPIEYFEDKYYTLDLHKQCLRLLENENWINQSDYMLVDYLLSWHFDIYGLIEKGLAIDINTI